MGEIPFRHKVIGLDHFVNVGTVDTHGDSHDHVLRALDNLAIDPEKV